MALKKAQNAKDMLQNPDVGNRVKEESKKAFTEWQAEHVRALDVIQDLYIVYYSRTSDLYRGKKPSVLQVLFRDGCECGYLCLRVWTYEPLTNHLHDYCLAIQLKVCPHFPLCSLHPRHLHIAHQYFR